MAAARCLLPDLRPNPTMAAKFAELPGTMTSAETE